MCTYLKELNTRLNHSYEYTIISRLDTWDHYPKEIVDGHTDDSIHILKVAHEDGGVFVLKVVDLYKDSMRHEMYMHNELLWLSRFKHTGITPVIKDIIDKNKLFGFTTKLYTETLFDYWHREKSLQNQYELKVDLIKKIVKIVRVLKENNCTHKDLTPKNFLMEDGALTLIDFQIAADLVSNTYDIYENHTVEQCCGSCKNYNLNDLVSSLV